MIEAALATPVFLLIVVGVMEFGLALKDYLAMSSGSRAAIRTAATLGNSSTTDHSTLTALRNGSRAISVGSGRIDFVVVYKATGPNDLLPTASGCLTASVTAKCNRYTPADLLRPAVDFGCGAAEPDRFWCPTGRKVAQSDPPDYVGVYVQVTHNNPTGMFGTTRTFTDQYVMRIEPQKL